MTPTQQAVEDVMLVNRASQVLIALGMRREELWPMTPQEALQWIAIAAETQAGMLESVMHQTLALMMAPEMLHYVVTGQIAMPEKTITGA